MTSKLKCQFNFYIEHVCLAFAIINMFGMALILVSSFVATSAFVVVVIRRNADHRVTGHSELDEFVATFAPALGVFAGIFMAFSILASLICFIFSVQLCNGIINRRPGLVIAYFIFGCLLTTLCTLVAAIVLMDSTYWKSGLLGLLGCAIYCLFLALVYRTYLKLERNAMFDHDHLLCLDT